MLRERPAGMRRGITAYAASETASGANPSSMFAAMPPNDMMPNAMAMRRDE